MLCWRMACRTNRCNGCGAIALTDGLLVATNTSAVYKPRLYGTNNVPQHHDASGKSFVRRGYLFLGCGVTNTSITTNAIRRGHTLNHPVTLCSIKYKILTILSMYMMIKSASLESEPNMSPTLTRAPTVPTSSKHYAKWRIDVPGLEADVEPVQICLNGPC
jgi:hypothetical protein